MRGQARVQAGPGRPHHHRPGRGCHRVQCSQVLWKIVLSIFGTNNVLMIDHNLINIHFLKVTNWKFEWPTEGRDK